MFFLWSVERKSRSSLHLQGRAPILVFCAARIEMVLVAKISADESVSTPLAGQSTGFGFLYGKNRNG
jgi:hypothetical protein